MKTLTCSLAAVLLSVAWGSAVFAAIDEVHHIVTGRVVLVTNEGYMEIDTHDGGTNFGVFVEHWGAYKPKVGDNVKVHIRPGGRRVYADSIEKIGKDEKGSGKK